MRRLYLPAPRIVRTFVTPKRISLQDLAPSQGERLPSRKCTCENTPMQKTLLAMLQAVALLAVPAALAEERPTLPDGFVYLDQAVPDLVMDLRYITEHNFVGEPIDGYRHGYAVLSAPAADALAKVQAALRPFGLGLKVFDAYRPQRAVDHFVRWGKHLGEQRTKAHYYPGVDKQNLFKEGYIAARSSHSRGSTVDLTLVSRDENGQVHELDMGSPFDFFGPISSPHSLQVNAQQRANRMLLHKLMRAHGFTPYAQEWWHFTLENEPWPDTYFDFPT